MTEAARSKWDNLEFDDQVVVDFAFQYAIAHPHQVPEYWSRIVPLRKGTAIIHFFRIGYVSFHVAAIGLYPIIVVDLRVDESIYTHVANDPELRP
jgi:hypothetical protein